MKPVARLSENSLPDLFHFLYNRRCDKPLGNADQYDGRKTSVGNGPVYRIRSRTSLARGGATSISSIFKGSPAPQHTAALHLIGRPTVSAISLIVESLTDTRVGRTAVCRVMSPHWRDVAKFSLWYVFQQSLLQKGK